ncbi:MAG: hypothetical protein LUC24_01110 [Bacteroidales bacterium]|nr:hypothetical protein [Bacteroidales bacterium]
MKSLFINVFSLFIGTMLLYSCTSDSDTPIEQIEDESGNVSDSGSNKKSNTNDSTVDDFVDFPVAEAIDMGLSVSWASWNMGESSPYDAGKTFG